MAATLDDLVSPETEDEALSYLLTELAAVGFPTTAWQTGAVIYTVLRVLGKKISDKVSLVAAIAKGGLLDYSAGAWLTLLAKSHYQLTRYAAAFAVGNVRVSIASGSSAQTIQPGQLWIQTATGKRYNSVNAAPVAISGGSSALIPFKAESAGTAYNVAVGTGLTLVTPLPGMTAAFEDAGSGTWLTTQGADEEQDEALRVRCRARWATIGIQKTRDAYVFLATNTPGVTTQPNRTAISDQNPRGPGTLDIWIAGPAGPLSTADETLIRNYVLARKSACADVQVANAIARPVTIVAAVEYDGAYTSAVAQAVDNCTVLINSLQIGGKLKIAELIEAIMTPAGIGNSSQVQIVGTVGDLTLAINEVATVAAVNISGAIVNP